MVHATNLVRGWYQGKDPFDLIYIAADGKKFRPTSHGKKEVTYDDSILKERYSPLFSDIHGIHISMMDDLLNLRKAPRIHRGIYAIRITLEDLSKRYPGYDPITRGDETPANFHGIVRHGPSFVR